MDDSGQGVDGGLVPELLERGRELALIDASLAAAATGSSSVLQLEGEAGVGKTALMRRAAKGAAERGLCVLTARGGVLERSRGFGVARQLLERAVVRATTAERRRLLSGAAGLAAPLLGVTGDGAGVGDPRDAADLGFHHALYWLVSNLSERSPTALLVDDVHWCDEATLEWLIYLLSRLEGLPLAILIAQRTGEPDTPRGLLDAIAAEPVTQLVALRALGFESTSLLVEAAYGVSADPDFCRACHAWTGGNPLFLSAVVAELVQDEPDRCDADARHRSARCRGDGTLAAPARGNI